MKQKLIDHLLVIIVTILFAALAYAIIHNAYRKAEPKDLVIIQYTSEGSITNVYNNAVNILLYNHYVTFEIDGKEISIYGPMRVEHKEK